MAKRTIEVDSNKLVLTFEIDQEAAYDVLEGKSRTLRLVTEEEYQDLTERRANGQPRKHD